MSSGCRRNRIFLFTFPQRHSLSTHRFISSFKTRCFLQHPDVIFNEVWLLSTWSKGWFSAILIQLREDVAYLAQFLFLECGAHIIYNVSRNKLVFPDSNRNFLILLSYKFMLNSQSWSHIVPVHLAFHCHIHFVCICHPARCYCTESYLLVVSSFHYGIQRRAEKILWLIDPVVHFFVLHRKALQEISLLKHLLIWNLSRFNIRLIYLYISLRNGLHNIAWIVHTRSANGLLINTMFVVLRPLVSVLIHALIFSFYISPNCLSLT